MHTVTFSFRFLLLSALKADAHFQDGELAVGLEAAEIEVGVVAERGAIDEMLFGFGVKELVEVVPSGDSVVFLEICADILLVLVEVIAEVGAGG
jgi:hypothetical protein